MAQEDLFQRGEAVRQEIWGDWASQRIKFYEDIDPSIARILIEYIFGTIWGRPTLDTKTRSLITVAVLTALNRLPELATHARGALHQGWTREEVREAVLHVGAYAGWPCTAEGLKRLQELFAELDKEQGGN